MKKFFVQVVILYCMLLGGCPNKENLQHLEEEKHLAPSPTAQVEDWASISSSLQDEPALTPTTAIQNAVAEISEYPLEFDLSNLGIVPYSGQDGEVVFDASTCFYDDNGLLCVALKAIYQEKNEECILEKSYFLSDGTLYKATELLLYHDAFQIFKENIIREQYETVAYEPIVFKTISGYIWTKDGRLIEASELLGEEYGSKFSCTVKEDYIPVTAGEKIKLNYYFSWFSDIAGILFLDADDKLISSYSFNSSTTVKDQFIKVPEGAKKMHLTLFNNQKYRLEREVSLIGADLKNISEEEYQTMSNEVLLEQKKQSEKEYVLDKAYVTFVLDDCRPDMDKIADIFVEQNVPLCIAAIYENLPFSASQGIETRLEVCERVAAAGGEMLAHDGEVITEELLSDYNGMVKHFYEDKWVLEQLGFDVNGIILAGGSGQVVGHETTDIWARANYKYSDLYGEQKYGEPYYHRRFWLANCQDNYQQLISEAIREKEWVVLYLHDLKEVNAEKLQELLQYVTSLDEEEIEVVTYKELYDMMWE